jgi:hypothetical protein
VQLLGAAAPDCFEKLHPSLSDGSTLKVSNKGSPFLFLFFVIRTGHCKCNIWYEVLKVGEVNKTVYYTTSVCVQGETVWLLPELR